MSDWAHLPLELICEILDRIPAFDVRAARAVCVSWRRAEAATHRKPEAPWLMLPGDTDATAKFFSLSTRRLRSTRLPDPPICSRVVIGSGSGWLVTADERCSLHLLNPVSGEQVPLPSITSLPFVQAVPRSPCQARRFAFSGRTPTSDCVRRCFFRKAVLAPAPRPDSYTVLLLINVETSRTELAFARNGDEAWAVVPDTAGAADITFHKGCFYMVTSWGGVVAWEPGAPSFVPTVGLLDISARNDHIYLAESPSGELIIVLRLLTYCARGAEQPHFQTAAFEVRVLDEREKKWVRRGGIGDAAVFVGVNRTFCISTEDCPELEANCVYFTDSCGVLGPGFSSSQHRHVSGDVGVYDLKRRRRGRIRGLAKGAHNWPPVWLIPSLT